MVNNMTVRAAVSTAYPISIQPSLESVWLVDRDTFTDSSERTSEGLEKARMLQYGTCLLSLFLISNFHLMTTEIDRCLDVLAIRSRVGPQ
jgi:hypothetical protein